MGGHALKAIETRRVDREEYTRISHAVLRSLHGFFAAEERKIRDLPSYRTKDTFGDLDILIETFAGDSYDYRTVITGLFAPRQIVHNGNCYSFDYLNFQVDLILIPRGDFETAYAYYSWNDLGNLAGRLFKKLGFKYGHRGLSYMFRDRDESHCVYAEVVVSSDIKKILDFADLDYERFSKGFDSMEEMFRWVSGSRYFNKDIFLLHNRNHVSRIRDRKRKMYNLFLKWCTAHDDLPAYPWKEMREQDGYAGQPEFLQAALEHFEGFADRYLAIVDKHEKDLKVKEKFNGEIVGKLTGLSGKELGLFMASLMASHGGKDQLWPVLLNATASEVEEIIRTGWRQQCGA